MNAASIVSVIAVLGLVFLSLLALYVEKGERSFRRTRRSFRRLPVWGKTFLAFFVGAWIAFASVKDGTNGVNQVEGDTNMVTQTEGNTNDCTNVEGTNNVGQMDGEGTNGKGAAPGPLMMGFFGRPNPALDVTPSITDEDIARMWRISSTTDVGGLAAPTVNAVTNAAWCDYGGMSASFRIKPVGWNFPYGDKATVGLTVFQNGDFRPNVKTHFFPRPFDVNLSLLPRMNWGLLPDGGESVFWHEHTSSNSLILAWNNALYNREVSCPTNFQAELFADGRFDYRYPNRTVHYAPAFPFDWDGDGFENSVDPDPYVANPIDAHGTNDEWLRVVCSNVFENVGGGVAFRGDVNTNAYYFVEVCAEKGAAPIYFNPDRTSRLGSPVVVAQGGVTNHVPLLIGVGYVVTSTVPISVSFTDIGFTQVTQNDERSYAVKWPLDAVFTEVYSNFNRTYTISFTPYDPGGTFTWDEAPSPSPLPLLLGAFGGPACGCVACSGNTVAFGCTASCTCNGNCQAKGGYCYENAIFAITGGVCRCGFDDTHPTPPESHLSTDPASFSISFSKSAVIFEDTYQDFRYGNRSSWMPRRSTRVYLTVSAFGGPCGADFTLTTANLEKLTPVSCGPFVLPSSMGLGSGESYHASFVCEGYEASGSAGDIEVSGTLTEREGGVVINADSSITAVRVELSPYVDAPENIASGRHSYGVFEYIKKKQYPLAPSVTWNPVGGGEHVLIDGSGNSYYRCPGRDCINPLRCELPDVVYVPLVRTLEPSGIETWDVNYTTYGVESGHAGGIGLLQRYMVVPKSVSFSQIAIEEVPCERGESTGYFRHFFSSELWSHTRSAGAGHWCDVDVDNRVGGLDYQDEAAIDIELPPMRRDGTIVTNDLSIGWVRGHMTWEIPFGWNLLGTEGATDPLGEFALEARQEFCLDEDGNCSVMKFGNEAVREINGRAYRRIYQGSNAGTGN